MITRGMSRLFGFGAVAAQGVMPVLAVAGSAAIFVASPDTSSALVAEPGWVFLAIVALNAAVQLLAATGVVGMYWIPRLVHLQRQDGYRVRPTGVAMLSYLALFPPALAAVVGLAWQQGQVPDWYFALGTVCWVVAIPALLDALLRAWRGTDAPGESGPAPFDGGPAGDLQPIGDFGVTLPRSWVELPREPTPGWAQQRAARLSSDPTTRDELTRRLERAQPELTGSQQLMVAVWVPLPTSAELVGMLSVDRVAPPAGQRVDRDDYRALIDPATRRRITVYGRYIDEIEVPAGPALVVTEVVGEPRSRWRPWDKMVGQNLTFTVFPPGCSEALRLAFSTAVVELADALRADATSTMESLGVSLRKVCGP